MPFDWTSYVSIKKEIYPIMTSFVTLLILTNGQWPEFWWVFVLFPQILKKEYTSLRILQP